MGSLLGFVGGPLTWQVEESIPGASRRARDRFGVVLNEFCCGGCGCDCGCGDGG